MNSTSECLIVILSAFAIGAPLLCALLAAMDRLGWLDGPRPAKKPLGGTYTRTDAQKEKTRECETTIARGIANMQELIEKGKL